MTADALTLTFAALADPTRRAILSRLAAGESSVTEIARPFKISLPAVTKHLKVLERCGLIARRRNAQWRPCRLEAQPMKEAADWLERYRQHWEESFDRLEDYLQELQRENKGNPMTQKNEASPPPADRMLTIIRVFNAPRPLVFEAWTQRGQMDRWAAPKGFTVTHSQGDPRPGGAWKFLMVAPDGKEHFASGIYREVIANELLVFTHGWKEDSDEREYETIVTVRFSDEGEKTKMVFEQGVFKSIESRAGHQGGWSQCFDQLQGLLNGLPGH